MIEMPTRSITRFFVPMIDVLTLLFCIYLLMPIVSDPEGTESEATRLQREQRLRELEAEVARMGKAGDDLPDATRREIERLRRERAAELKSRLSIRVLEIDAGDGKLHFRGLKGERIELRSEADAVELIKRDQERTGAEKRELYYQILYPRDPKSAYPTVGQKRAYDGWFREVALGYDVPGLELGRQP